jgi:hypothetical protein
MNENLRRKYMLTTTEFMSQCTAPNLARPLPRTTSKPELGEIVVFTDNAAMRRAFWSSPVYLPKKMARV